MKSGASSTPSEPRVSISTCQQAASSIQLSFSHNHLMLIPVSSSMFECIWIVLVVLNDDLAVIGQLISNGVEVSLSDGPLANPFGLCIATFNGTVEIDNLYTILGFAYIVNGSSDQTIRALPNSVSINSQGLVCCNLTESGIYFVVYLQEDWPAVYHIYSKTFSFSLH